MMYCYSLERTVFLLERYDCISLNALPLPPQCLRFLSTIRSDSLSQMIISDLRKPHKI